VRKELDHSFLPVSFFLCVRSFEVWPENYWFGEPDMSFLIIAKIAEALGYQ
jgi:hypothetical protein